MLFSSPYQSSAYQMSPSPVSECQSSSRAMHRTCTESAVPDYSSSTPESWAQFTHCNIYKAEQERMNSINLRALFDKVLEETSKDLHQQYDRVNATFKKHLEEPFDTKAKLDHHLRKILEQIAAEERNIANLKQAIKDKEAPLRVAQTRLYERTYRPNVELTIL